MAEKNIPESNPTRKREQWSFVANDDIGGFAVFLSEAARTKGVHPSHERFEYADCLFPEDGQQYADALANVRMIVAAKTMYKALEKIADDLTIIGVTETEIEHLRVARAAIAEAEGAN